MGVIRFSSLFILLFSLLFITSGCGDPSDTAAVSEQADDASWPDGLGAIAADDDASEPPDEEDNNLDEGEDEELIGPPLGENPALHNGPFHVKLRRVLLRDTDFPTIRSAYLFIPSNEKWDKPLPTIIWGHGIASADWPFGQYEFFHRQASKGYLVIYPNMDVTFPITEQNVRDSIRTYLRAARKAVRWGLADPERIIFGGFSYGARIAALATAQTTGLDPLNIWPDPVACVYEALPDFTESAESWPLELPDPQPSDWAKYIDPEIPQTILVAEDDHIVENVDLFDNPINGAYFFAQLPSDFAQLIVLKSGSQMRDKAGHYSFLASRTRSLTAFDLWGHMKIVSGLAYFHFLGGHPGWAYGMMRAAGGLDSAGKPIIHEVYEKRGEEIDEILPTATNLEISRDSSADNR